jgi:hyperosmotically inducible protein
MYTPVHQSILASSVALAIAVISSPAVAATVSEDITDTRQETQIWTTYALSPYLRANDLKVSVHNGKAVLTGKVEESVNKDLAKQIALGVKGIKEVDNQILVQADYKAPARAAERSYGDVVDDATVTAAVKSKLLWSKNTHGLSTAPRPRSWPVIWQ